MNGDEYIKKEFKELIGKTIKDVRELRPEEYKELYWHESPYDPAICIVFTDKTAAVVSADTEGNGPGWLFIADIV
jgi:hypothetical protein